MRSNRVKRKIRNFLLVGMVLAFVACGQATQQDAPLLPQQETESGWKQNGFVRENAISDNLLNTVNYTQFEAEQQDHVQRHIFRQAAYGNNIYILNVFYKEQGPQYLLQRVDTEGNMEQTELRLDNWDMVGGHILGIDVVDATRLVFWVAGEYEKNSMHQLETEHYYAVYTDHRGNMQKSVDIIDILREEKIWEKQGYAGQDIYCDGVGNIYICDKEQHEIYVVDQQGALVMSCLYETEEKQNVLQGFRTDEGDLIFACGKESMQELIWLDTSTCEVKKLSNVDIKGIKKWYGMYEGILYYATEKQVVGWNVVTGEQNVLLLPDANVLKNMENTVLVGTEKRIQLFVTGEDERYIITFSDEEPVLKGQINLVNICSENSFLAGQVAVFARKNPWHEVVYQNACQEDEAARVLMQVMNGEGPDILYVSRTDMDNLQTNGVLGDLAQLLSAETLDVMLPGALEMGTYDDKLIGIPLSVSARTMFSSQKYWQEETWTVRDALDILEEQDGVEAIFTDMFGQQSYFYNMYFLVGIDIVHSPFIKDGSSRFDSPEFRELLRVVKEKTNENSDLPSSMKEIAAQLKEGRCLGVEFPIFDMAALCSVYEKIGEDAILVGYPTEAGSGNYLQADGMIVVNRNAMEKEGVIELLDYLYSLESQRQLQNTISVRLDIPECQIEYDASGEQYFWVYTDGTKKPMKSRQDGTSYLEQYVDFLESAVPYSYDSQLLFEIVQEEANSYFYSDKDIDEVIKAIQRRVQIYLDEQK